MFRKVTIAGDGAMGTVCAMLLCHNNVDTVIWGYDRRQIAEMQARRENVRFLPGFRLPQPLKLEADDAKAFKEAEMIVSAVPCQFLRGVWNRLAPFTPPDAPVVSVTKGIENKTLLRPTQILSQILGPRRRLAVLSGPTIADEIARGLPATAVAAGDDVELTRQIQETFSTSMFRVYTNDDLPGVEMAGAMKNVIAIAAGIIDGIGAGDNAKAALLCRGLAEIERLAVECGAKGKTLAGLAGLGDLVTTCISPKGRNRTFGQRIAEGMTAKQALAATESVVEGASTCQSVLAVAQKYNIEMPITGAVCAVITGRKGVRQAIAELMNRQLKSE